MRASSTCGEGVLRGLGVSSCCADFDFPVFVVSLDVFFAAGFLIPFFGFGVAVWWRLIFGVGDFFGLEVDECVSFSSD